MGCHDSGRAPPGLAVSASCASFLLPAPVSFRSRRRRVPGQHPLSRVSHMRTRPRSRRRGFARLIARARASARRTCPVRSYGDFLRRQESKRPPDAASSCLILPWIFQGQAYSGIISPSLELARQVGRSCPDRPPVEPVPPRGDTFGQRLLGPAGQRHRLARPLAGRRARHRPCRRRRPSWHAQGPPGVSGRCGRRSRCIGPGCRTARDLAVGRAGCGERGARRRKPPRRGLGPGGGRGRSARLAAPRRRGHHRQRRPQDRAEPALRVLPPAGPAPVHRALHHGLRGASGHRAQAGGAGPRGGGDRGRCGAWRCSWASSPPCATWSSPSPSSSSWTRSSA